MAAAPEGRPPGQVRGATLGQARGFGFLRRLADRGQPRLGCGRLLGQDEDADVLADGGRGFEAPVVNALPLLGPYKCAESPVKERVLPGRLHEVLVAHGQLGADRLDVVMAPGDLVPEIWKDQVGFDHGRLDLVGRGGGVGVANLDRGKGEPFRPPQLDGRGRRERGTAFGLDMNDRIVRLDPDAGFDWLALDLAIDDDFALAEPQLLPEARPGEGIGSQGDADAPDLDQPVVVVPGVGLADIEEDVARGLHPDVEPDVAVAERHGPEGVLAGGVPDDVVGVGCRALADGRQEPPRSQGGGSQSRPDSRPQGQGAGNEQKSGPQSEPRLRVGFHFSHSRHDKKPVARPRPYYPRG